MHFVKLKSKRGINMSPSDLKLHEVSSIRRSMLLVFFEFGAWSGNKQDKQASDELAISKNASTDGSIRVYKSVMSCKELKDCDKFGRNKRNQIHYKLAKEWAGPIRILPRTKQFEYKEQITQAEVEYLGSGGLVDKFLDVYEWRIEDPRKSLGELFDEANYPSRVAIRSKFHWKHAFLPIQEEGDFRVEVNDEGIEDLCSQFSEFVDYQTVNLYADLLSEAESKITNMIKQLEVDPNKLKKDGTPMSPSLHESTFKNVLSVLENLGDYNYRSDPKVRAARDKLRSAVEHVNIEILRTSEQAQEKTKISLASAVKEVQEAQQAYSSIDDIPSLGQ